MKINKKLLIITSVILLLPMIAGLILWSRLPDTIATQFGPDNAANGWSSKPFAVFGIPGIMLALHWLCLFATAADPKSDKIGKKAITIVYWILPLVSLCVMSFTYANALGVSVNVGFWCCLMVGILLIVLGNYMPKARQNYTFGIKTPWALEDEENWNKSNRLAGWLAIFAGLILIVNAFILSIPVLIVTVVIFGGVPVLYSYYLYRKKKKE